jgi:hypothetical protein
MTDTYEDLKDAVEENGGLYVTTMAELRDIRGAGRLSAGICNAISADLASHGLGHIPDELPTSQWSEARIYRLGSPIAAVASAVLEPSTAGDKTLRNLSSDDAQDIIQRIRELVCEA